MIEVSHLTKRYGNHLALSDLSFTIPNGQIYGLLGPNGAGKSTTMNILTGCLAATSGEVRIDGVDIFEDPMAAKRHLGYLPEQPPVYMDRTPWEYLRFVARAKGVKNLAQEVDRVLRVTVPENLDYMDLFTDLFEDFTTQAQLTRVKTVNMGSLYSLEYQVRLKETAKEKQLLDAMRCRNGNLEISSGLPAEPKDGERL